jgi:hypothetical protein
MGIVTRGSSDTAQFQAILVCIFVGAAAAAVALGRGLVAQPLQIVASVLLAAVGVTALVQAFRLLRSGRLEPV